ncbi:MAG TPA: ABC transporter substrate-binding protein [Symbiobacteriaceae bacterium]|nr:ABC transporter substrate-binding protein [Symbiobacteriaceae bacterium]
MKRFAAVILSLAMLAGIATGCSEPAKKEETKTPAPAAEQKKVEVPGVTDTTVKVGGFAAQSGAVAPIGISVRKGFEAYIKYVNEQGGVHGRKIEVVKVVDDAFDAAKGFAASKELVESDKVFALAPVLGTPGVQASVDYWVEQKVPVVYPMTGIEQTAHPAKNNVFAVQPNNFDEAKILTQYAIKDLGKKKIAVLWQNSDMGKQGLKGVQEQVKAMGAEIVYDGSHEAKAVDFATPVLNAKSKGAEAVIIYTTLAESVGIMKEMQKQGFTAVPLTSYVNADPVNIPKLAGDAAVGLITGGWVPVADPNSPDIKKFYEVYGKYYTGTDGKPETPNAYTTAGWIAAELLVKGLQDTGKDLTREKFIAALEALKNWNGIMAKDISYGPGDRRGSTAFYLNQVKKDDKGNIVMLPINTQPYRLSK